MYWIYKQAREAYNSGKYVIGERFARKARNFAIASIFSGIIVIGILLAGLSIEIFNTVRT